MDLGARRHGRDEAEFVRAVVDYIAITDNLVSRIDFQSWDQTQRQKPVCDRPLERALALRSLDINVNPLMVAGDIGKLVDLLLSNLDFLAPAAVLRADFRSQFLNVVKFDAFHFGLLVTRINASPQT